MTSLDAKKPAPHWLTEQEMQDLDKWHIPGLGAPYYTCHALTSWWYFWDETQAYCHGPYYTRKDVERALKDYGESL